MKETAKLQRQVEALERGTESRHRKIFDDVDTFVAEGGHDGQEALLRRSDGGHDVLKRTGKGKVMRISESIDGLEVVQDDEGIPKMVIVRNGKKYRLLFEEDK